MGSAKGSPGKRPSRQASSLSAFLISSLSSFILRDTTSLNKRQCTGFTGNFILSKTLLDLKKEKKGEKGEEKKRKAFSRSRAGALGSGRWPGAHLSLSGQSVTFDTRRWQRSPRERWPGSLTVPRGLAARGTRPPAFLRPPGCRLALFLCDFLLPLVRFLDVASSDS